MECRTWPDHSALMWAARHPYRKPMPSGHLAPCRSEIRLVRTRRDSAVLGSTQVFGADILRPPGRQRASIRYCRRPRCREGAFIIDRELEMQPLTLVGRIDDQRGVVVAGIRRFSFSACCQAFLVDS